MLILRLKVEYNRYTQRYVFFDEKDNDRPIKTL